MFDLPDVRETDTIGQLDLVQGVLDQAVLTVVVPRPAHLVLVEDPEPHPADVSTRQERC